LKALETRGDVSARYAGKLTLVKSLYDRGLSREQVLRLFRLMDWMLKLPQVLRRQFIQEIDMYEREKQMPLLSPTEQMWRDDALAEGEAKGLQKGLEKGRREGRQETRQETLLEGIEVALSVRFGNEGVALMPKVRKLADETNMSAFLHAIKTASDLDSLRNMLPPM
jgi:hypothetical protein